MKKYIFLSFLFILISTSAFSQLQKSEHLFGPSIGLFPKEKSAILGINYEYMLMEKFNGLIGIGGVVRYWSVTKENVNFSYTFLGGQANYHFHKLGDGKIEPFLGVVVGLNSIRNGDNGLWFWGQAGARYFFTPTLAISARTGVGNNSFFHIEFGLDFKVK